MGGKFTHFDRGGRAVMVGVSAKPETHRVAVATASVRVQPATAALIDAGTAGKGDVLGAARIAGITATKRTADLIPLCHPLRITRVSIDFDVGRTSVAVRAVVEAHDRTGVEMEAMTAASVAALTIYDMCKAVDRGMVVENVQLEEKRGGKSGIWRRS